MSAAGAPFQTDGSCGYPAAVEAMLLQSLRNAKNPNPGTAPCLINLLPALPEARSTGKVAGLNARGNFTVDIEWEDGKVTRHRIASPKPREVKVRVNGETKAIR